MSAPCGPPRGFCGYHPPPKPQPQPQPQPQPIYYYVYLPYPPPPGAQVNYIFQLIVDKIIANEIV